MSLLSAKTWFSVGARRRPSGWHAWVFQPFALAVGGVRHQPPPRG
jgi:hypothetical protein